MISASAARAAARAGSRSTRMKLWSLPSSRSMRERRLSASSTGESSRLPISALAGERQVAIVTGAASGIGRAMSLGLLGGGIDVAAVDREPAWLDELKTAASGRRFTGALQTIRADLTDPTSFDAIVSAVLSYS